MGLKNTKVLYSESFTDPTNEQKLTTNVQTLSVNDFAELPANFLAVRNGTSKVIDVVLNGNIVLPVSANGGTLAFARDDLVRYSDLEVQNNSGSDSTGNVNITYGWLYQKIIGTLDVLPPDLS